jgi:hypothetical protein
MSGSQLGAVWRGKATGLKDPWPSNHTVQTCWEPTPGGVLHVMVVCEVVTEQLTATNTVESARGWACTKVTRNYQGRHRRGETKQDDTHNLQQ